MKRLILASAFILFAVMLPAQAQQRVVQKPLSIPDVNVQDQNGRTRKFYSDLVKGRVVVINFVFTSCKAICPQLGINFSRMQNALGERFGRDVFLISISTDPETDTPAKLKAWSEKFKAQDGWTLVTGQTRDLTSLLQVLTGDGPGRAMHSPSIVIVDEQKRTYRRAYGLETPERLVKMVDELVQAR